MAKGKRANWLFVADIARAIEAIRTIGVPEDRSDVRDARLARLALERALEIISEASRHVPEETKAQYAQVPRKRVADFGNFLRHACFGLDTSLIDAIVANDIPVLEAIIGELQHKFLHRNDCA
jgi:uncharacterized protein with HEPN domain